MLNERDFAKSVNVASQYMAAQRKMEDEFRKLGEWGRIGLIGACIQAGHNTEAAMTIQAQKLLSTRDMSGLFWLADKGTGVTRQRRLWFRKPDGTYVLRD